MKKYVTEIALERLLGKSIPAAYHIDSACMSLLRRCKGSVVELPASVEEKQATRLKPCKTCAEPRSEIPVKHNGDGVAATTYPYSESVTIWHCSDGYETTREAEALRHELDLMRERMRRGR